MRTRKRNYEAGNAGFFNQLLLDVVQAVDEDIGSPSYLSKALMQIRDFFSFGNAFIYEADPNRRFLLQEHSETYRSEELVASFVLEDILIPAQIAYASQNPFCCARQDLNGNEIQDAVCSYFGFKSVFLVFITDNAGAVVGCIGMADKREHLPLDFEEFFQASILIKLVAEHSRFRIYQRLLEYTSSTLENIMDHTGFDIYVNDFYTHEMLYANESMSKPYGGWENMRGKTCYEALYKDQPEECSYCPKKHLIDEDGNPTKVYAWDYQRPFDGVWFRVISAAFRWTDGRLAQVISSANINEAKKNELLIQQMAFRDLITGIPNRRKLEQDLQEVIGNSNHTNKGVTIFFLDLDGFKAVNDTYGHSVGDDLLKHVAKLFLDSPLTAEHCYRYGGDEFIFLFEGLSPDEEHSRSAEIINLLETPFIVEGDEIVPTGSIGFARYPEDGTDYWMLLDKADSIMYTAKQARKLSLAPEIATKKLV